MSGLRRLPSLNALRAFEAAARLHSVGGAAAELHVTHGAVSRQIRLLEEELGLALLQREGRGIRPTAAGERLRDAAGGAFAQLQDAVAELRRPARPSALVLGCPGSILARWMIPRLQALQRDLPALTLHLSAHEGEFGPDLDGLDAALLLGQAPWPDGWQVHVLAQERIGPVLSPAALRYGTGFEHLYYLLEAALAGIGVAIAPQPLVADDLASGRLLAPWGFAETGGQWALCARREQQEDPRVQALARWLAGELRQGGG